MKTSIIAALLISLLSGCVTPPPPDLSIALNTWLDANEATLVRQKGPPSRVSSDGSNGKVLIYESSGPAMVIPGSIRQDGFGGYQQNPSLVLPPLTHSAQFYIDETGRVYGWRYDGQSRFVSAKHNPEPVVKAVAEKPAINETEDALNRWEEMIRRLDPNFGDVTDLRDPKHGKSGADQVFDAIVEKNKTTPNASTADLVSEAQRAYDKWRVATNVETQNPKPKN